MTVPQVNVPGGPWVQDWLERLGIASAAPVMLERIGGGYSNLTYRVADSAGTKWVLRRPPHGNLLPSAHDVTREARIMHALRGSSVPVPRIGAVAVDDSGTPWVLMEYIEGAVLDSVAAGESIAMQDRYGVGRSMVETLASLHDLDLEHIGLADLSSHAPYAERQLRRWQKQWEASRTLPRPELDQLTRRLSSAIPNRHEIALLHGDFHLKNVIVRSGRVVAALDWELSTLGDPLADLGTLFAYWPHAGEFTARDLDAPSTVQGFPTRENLLSEYARASGRDVSTISFWHVLGLWKLAIIGMGVLRRAKDDPRARSLAITPTEPDIDQILSYAHEIADAAHL